MLGDYYSKNSLPFLSLGGSICTFPTSLLEIVSCTHTFDNSLHQEIEAFCKYLEPTEEEKQMRIDVVGRITNVILDLWPNAEVSCTPYALIFSQYVVDHLNDIP